jgi:hypothetical protein
VDISGKQNVIPAGDGKLVVATDMAGTVELKSLDTSLTVSTSVPPTSNAVKTAVDAKQDKIPANAGKVLTATATAGTTGTLSVDTTVTASSANLITSGAVKTAISGATESIDLSGKQDKIAAGAGKFVAATATAGTVELKSLDTSLSVSTAVPPTSGAVKTAVDAKQDKIEAGAGKYVTATATAGTVSLVDRAEDASLTFFAGEDEVPVFFPTGVKTFYVTGKYSSGTAATLRIKEPAGSYANVSASSSSPTTGTSYAGKAVIFGITGPSGDGTFVFGLRLGY